MNEISNKLKQKQWEINKKKRKKFEWMKLRNVEKSKRERKKWDFKKQKEKRWGKMNKSSKFPSWSKKERRKNEGNRK